MVTIARFVNSRGAPSPHLLVWGIVVVLSMIDPTSKNKVAVRILVKLLFVGLSVCLAACQASEPVLVYDGKKLETKYGIQSLAWHPGGKIIAVGYFMQDEVEVWDIESNQSLLTIPSKRRPINQSGQELLFSPDGRYLVVQDTRDNRNGVPPISRRSKDPDDAEARKDVDRFRLASVWDVRNKVKVSELNGPASGYHGLAPSGMCWRHGSFDQMMILRNYSVQYFDVAHGVLIHEASPHKIINYWPIANGFFKFSCSNSSDLIVTVGYQQFPNAKGWWDKENMSVQQTPITLIQNGKVVSEAYSATMLHNARFVGDDRLITYGWYPLRIWSTQPTLKQIGEIPDAGAGEAGFVVLPDKQHVVGIGKKMEVWDLTTLKKVQSLPSPSEPFRAELSPSGRELAVASGRTIYFYRNTLSPEVHATKKEEQ